MGELDGALDGAGVSRDHDLLGRINIGRLANFSVRRVFRNLADLAERHTKNGRHRAHAHGHRFLHILAAISNRPHCIGKGQRAGGHVRRILAQAVPGNIVRNKIRLQTFFLQHTPRRHRRRQDGRLRDLGQLQFFFRTFETKLRQLVSERLVRFLKGATSNRVIFGQLFAHANGLRTLAGKEKSDSRRTVCHIKQ